MSVWHKGQKRNLAGFALLEALIAIVILMFGLLGLAGLLAKTHTAEFESYQRKQAVILLEDMLGRVSANPNAATCYAVSASNGSGYLGDSSSTAGACAAGTDNIPTSDEATRANTDLGDWSKLLKGASEVQSGNKVGAAMKARGCVVNNGALSGFPNVTKYTISVAWQGTTEFGLPSDDTLCAKGSYSSDGLRRIISVPVYIPNLN